MYLYISGVVVVGKMAGWRDVKSSIGGSKKTCSILAPD